MSTSTEYMAGMNAPIERRFYSRVTPPTPIYVAFGSNNLGIIHNVSENGFQVETPDSLPINSVFKVFLTLTGASRAISVSVRTIWTTETEKRSGIQLLDLAEMDRQQIRDWVELETSRNENPAPAGRIPPNRTAEQPVVEKSAAHISGVDNFSDLSAAPGWIPRPSAKDREEIPPTPQPHHPPTMTPNQPEAAGFAGSPESTQPHADLFGAAKAESAFPPVPLPIHPDFDYEPRAESTRRRTRYSRWRKKPLLLWAAVLAMVCLGADVLVKHKIAANARRYAAASQKNDRVPAQQNPDADAASTSADNSTTSATDAVVPDSNAASATPAPAVDSTMTAQTNASPKSATPRSQRSTLDSEPAQTARPGDSDSTDQTSAANSVPAANEARGRDRVREYIAATAPPPDRANDSANAARPVNSNASTQPPATAQASPAPSSPALSNAASSVPNTTVSAANTTPTPSASAPAPVRTQAPPPVVNSQPPQVSNPIANNTYATVASNQQSNPSSNNPPPTRSAANQPNSNPSAIYNANGNSAQRSAILGSINSVRPSGIFTSASSPAAPPSVSPDPSSYTPPARTNPGTSSNSANSYVATRTAPVNSGTVQMDTPQDRDIEIPAPKGFNASYVEIPGERTIRSPSATIHIQRLVRVPGERVPGQRWLWKGHMNVTLGELLTRVDPAVAQAAATSGSLTVEAIVDKDGYVTDLKPLYGNFAMLPAVSRAVRSWRYQPTYLDNKRAETQAKIEFDLHPATANNRAARQ
jgi:hypothetical protein